MQGLPFTFDHGATGLFAGLLALAAITFGAWRRTAAPRSSIIFACVGIVALALAASGLAIVRPAASPVAIWVDLSPSTRGANYRSRTFLNRRIAELLGNTPREIRFFSDRLLTVPENVSPLPDSPADLTSLPDTDAPVIVLFSDGHLRTPNALPPAYAVLDSGLDHVNDAAVVSLNTSRGDVEIRAYSQGTDPRLLALQGVIGESPVSIGSFSQTLVRKPASDALTLSASFAPGDAWPENDAIQTTPPPPTIAERWWVGENAPAGWRLVSVAALPVGPAGYLGTSVVVLSNTPARALDSARQSALSHYVKTLGGGLVLLGGDHAFAAGGMAGTVLDDLSPLASSPPEPTTRWLILADASGSMNSPAGASSDRTRWTFASSAFASAIQQLPPADLLRVGSFSDEVRWASKENSVAEIARQALWPTEFRPRARTQLSDALRGLIEQANEKMPTHAVVATDGQAAVDAPGEIADAMKSRSVRLHVLLIGDSETAEGVAALRSIATETGGSFRFEEFPENWAAGLSEVLRGSQPDTLVRGPTTVQFDGEFASLPATDTPIWNTTWAKSNTGVVASILLKGVPVTVGAKWNFGEGRVAAMAFATPATLGDAIAKSVEQPARDPRFSIDWQIDSSIAVTVDALDGQAYLNGETFTVERNEANGSWTPHPIPQTAPGRYAWQAEAPRQPALFRVRRAGQTLATVSVPARYAPEFNAIGNDRTALAALARRTGGAVVEPGVTKPLDLSVLRKSNSLVSWLAVAGAASLLAALVRWRIGN